jgi:hypothetical protein
VARLHAYQGKTLLAGAGVAVPEGGPVTSAAEAEQMARHPVKAVLVERAVDIARELDHPATDLQRWAYLPVEGLDG